PTFRDRIIVSTSSEAMSSSTPGNCPWRVKTSCLKFDSISDFGELHIGYPFNLLKIIDPFPDNSYELIGFYAKVYKYIRSNLTPELSAITAATYTRT
ncbi:MAG: hypothetical protein AAFY41_11115, partial [Bacteroidota bacterium]